MTTEHELFTDYNWITFMAAIMEMNSTEFYGESYPLLEKYCNEFGIDGTVYTRFLHKAIEQERLTYQTCLEDIITVFLDGNRYGIYGIEHARDAIQFCLNNGATFPQDRLFARRYEVEEDASLEDEIQDYEVRGKLIDMFHREIDFSKVTDWSSIEGCYWEDLDDDENSDINRFRHLKHCSKHLLKVYPIPINNKEDEDEYDSE